MISFKVTPLGRFNKLTIFAVLLPQRAGAALGARVALRAGLALDSAAWARCLATRAFFVVADVLLVLSCGIEVVILRSPLRDNRRVMTLIPLFGRTSKSILEQFLEEFALSIPVRHSRDLAQFPFREKSGFARGQKQNVFLDGRGQLRQQHDL
jgi:hypothetical protein